MNKADLEADYMLNCKRTIWLAENVEDALLERITAQMYYLRASSTEPIHLYVRSDGGDSRTGMALVNMIRWDGNIHGWLIGDTASSAATIWAACAKRYVFANVRMGIHPVTWQENMSKYDGAKLTKLTEEFTKIDERQCAIYTAASNKDFAWWWERYNQAGDVKWLDAQELISIGMAQPAQEGMK